MYENLLKSEPYCLKFAFYYITDCQQATKQVLVNIGISVASTIWQTGVQKYTHRSLTQSYAPQVSTYYKHLKKGAHQRLITKLETP